MNVTRIMFVYNFERTLKEQNVNNVSWVNRFIIIIIIIYMFVTLILKSINYFGPFSIDFLFSAI